MHCKFQWMNRFTSTFLAILLFVTVSLLTFPDIAMAISDGNELACNLDFTGNDLGIISGIVAWSGCTSLGSIVLRTVTTTIPAPGILGWFGKTTEIVTTVTAPVGAIIAVGGLLTYGFYKVVDFLNCA